MKRICVLTATRAEYGLLSPLIKKLNREPGFDVRLVVTGMHLSPEFGLTWKEIEADGIHIDKKTEMLLSADTPAAITKSMGVALICFADYFTEINPDALIVLGDRYETLAVCIAAMNARIPVIHIHGGETTEGVIDEAVRHSVTKMSICHFTSTEEYRRRIIQMGEQPSRVFNVGALGVENALHVRLSGRQELESRLGIPLSGVYAVGTFHPVTLERTGTEEQIRELLKALDQNSEITYLFTKANADQDGRIINDLLKKYAEKHNNFFLADSLGAKNYLSALKYTSFVIGNSSSGLIEAPAFGIPTINIGDRQKGRIAGKTVINCTPEAKDIDRAVKKAMDKVFRNSLKNAVNPYGDGNTSGRIVDILKQQILCHPVNIKKQFYNIELTNVTEET